MIFTNIKNIFVSIEIIFIEGEFVKLIIAEKPSLARTIVKALSKEDSFDKKGGYFEGKKYIVTFAFGHLFQLWDINDYTGEPKGKWKLEGLPFIPEEFQFSLARVPKDKSREDGIKQQFKTIKELAARKNVDALVNCGDSDREGQVIGDLIINHVFDENKEKKPVYRLWLPEQTEETICAAVKNMKSNEEYTPLYNEGIARMYMDWLLGINITRYVSIKLNHLMPAGRVLIPIVKIIYDRDMAIRNFKPQKYFQVESNEPTNGETIKLTIKQQFETAADCQTLIDQLNNQDAIVSKIETKDVIKQASKLFSLSTLQSRLSKKYKMTLKDSLAIIQGLYEKGYVTYPRTNSEYLATAEKEKAEKIIAMINAVNPILEMKDKKSLFDDSKIESHSALIITTKQPKNGELSEQEQIVYDTIKNRFICNFLKEETIISRTVLEISIGNEIFTLKGDVVKQEGFLKYEPLPKKEGTLPNLQIGDLVNKNFKPTEKETTPPAKFDISMLSNYLKNPFKDELKASDDAEDRDDTEDYKAMLNGVEIGTEATRTGIIENAKKAQYISENNTKLSIEPLGEKLINTLDKLRINLYKEKTVEFSKRLKDVFKNSTSVKNCIGFTADELQRLIEAGNSVVIEQIASEQSNREIIGKCPRCGKNIYEGEKSFYCEGFKSEKKCAFAIWKQDRFWEPKGKKVTKSMAKNFLLGKAVKVKGLKKKDGSGTYDATISMNDTGRWVNFEMSFDKK